MENVLENNLVNYFKNTNLNKVIVAYSGGKDSTALLYLLNKIKKSLNLEIYACHINHGIRGAKSEKDAEFCENFCNEINIKIKIFNINVPEFAKKNKLSLEQAARELRYKYLFDFLKDTEFDVIATAHHKSDLVETFFIKLFQGASILNLRGFNNNLLIRPFLNLDKEIIDKYITESNLPFTEDETNKSINYLRNWLRHKIIPEINIKNSGYLNNIINIQNESEELKNYIEQNVNKNLIIKEDNLSIKIDKKQFNKLHLIEKKYIIAKVLEKRFRLEKKHIEEVLKISESTDSKRLKLPKNLIVEVSYEFIRFFNQNIIKKFNYEIKSDGELFIEHLNKKIILNNLVQDNNKVIIRNRKNGDIFRNKKLKDIFIDKKIELFIRDISIILEVNNYIVWVENLSENSEQIKLIG
jgi:tRNA(Ile)-lysidine synthase